LLTGATGFLGHHVIEALKARGHEVRALVRAQSRAVTIEGLGALVVRGSFDDPGSLREAAEVDAIVHAAGGGIVRSTADFYRGNTDTTRALLEAAPSTLARFVLVSSLAAHGPSRGAAPDDESVADAPVSHYGRSKLLAEQAALACVGRFAVTALRPPALYGPGEHRMVGLFRAAERGIVPMVHPSGTLSMLHGADCAEAIARALEVPHESGVYFVAEPRVYGRREMAELIGRAVGRRVRVVPVHPSAMHAIGAAVELAGRIRRRPVMLSRDKAADATQRHQSCDPSRAQRVLTWSARHGFEAGARESYADYRRRGWL
jgi:nucleoside-diphosphate-sugar epimerase